MSYNALSIANAFVQLALRDGNPLTNMKLQKLLYFAEGHSLSLRGERLILEEPQAWDYGPVYPTVYHEFKHYGAGPIVSAVCPPFCEPRLNPWSAPPNADVMEFLEAVWNAYRGVSAIRLSEMSHDPRGPWAEARQVGTRGAIISPEDMRSYFTERRGSQG